MICGYRHELWRRSRSAFLVQFFAVSLVVAFFAVPTRAQDQQPPVHAAALLVTPFVIEQHGSLSGFSIDLWNAIASRLRIKTTNYYVVLGNDTSAMLEVGKSNVRSGGFDVLVTPVFITSARAAEFDFSYPVMQTGLQIMLRASGESAQPPHPFLNLLGLLLSLRMLLWLGIGMILILIPAHLIWFFDRHRPDGITHGEPYLHAIFNALIWAATALVTQMQQMPGGRLARVVAVVWMFAGVVFVAYYTAQLTATLAVEQIRSSMEGPGDLPGKQVGALVNSDAVNYLRAENVEVQAFEQPEQMFQALLDEKLDAVVAVAPILLYYAARRGKGRVKVVGAPFNAAPFVMLFPLGSPLRRQVDKALIALHENGAYEQIYEKWFGSP